MKTYLKTAAFFSALVLLAIPFAVSAEVYPLSPLPTNFGGNTDTLPGYINTVFQMVIATAAALAILRIIWGGFRYMTSEAVTSVKDARIIITMAIAGLMLLLGSWLILSLVNPNILNLDALDFTPLSEARTAQQIQSAREENSQRTTVRQVEKGTYTSEEAEKRVSECPNGDTIIQTILSRVAVIAGGTAKYKVVCNK